MSFYFLYALLARIFITAVSFHLSAGIMILHDSMSPEKTASFFGEGVAGMRAIKKMPDSQQEK